ncbi:MAG: DNA primase [Holosporaceae bacterium]|jgi:DNA primase|nr:DNA primase [Holosporaceae bacterium]
MNKEFIDFLKSKVSIVDVVSARIRLRRSGKDWFGLCPFHKEKTGSFKVDPDKGFYHCFGCGAGGDVIKFVQEYDKISFNEAVEHLANFCGVQLPRKEKVFADPNKPIYEAIAEIKNWFFKQLFEPIGEEARKYLESRRISKESVEKFQLGFAPDNRELFSYMRKRGFSDDILIKTGVCNRSKYDGGLIGRYNGRLIFPIIDSFGKCVGFGGRIIGKEDAAKYVNSPETEIYVKSDHLYGYFLAKRGKSRQIILTEGYLDVISMHQAGFDGAAAPLGTTISEKQINMCWNVCENPIVALDGDGAGIKASYRWIDRILPALKAGRSFKFARLPQGADPDELISSGQADAVRAAVENAIPLSDWMWEGAFALYPSETPEQKASIIKTLSEKIATIKDDSIRKFYSQTLKQKERELYYRPKSAPKVKKENIRPVIPAREKIEKIFVATALNHPYIIDKIAENFIGLELKDFQMRKIKDKIFEAYNNYRLKGEADKYVEAIALLKNEFAAEVKDAGLRVKFSRETASDEEAEKGWLKLMDKYLIDPLVAADLQNAAFSLESTFSESDWQRLKALKQEVISNRIDNRE